MDDLPSQETNYFLTNARAKPKFLIQHCKSLAHIIFDRYKTKILVKLRGRHLGTKSMPAWLNTKKTSASKCKEFSILIQQIPQRLAVSVKLHESVRHQQILNTTNDPENYLAQQRWNILVDDYFSKPNPWILPIAIKEFIENSPPKTDAVWETYSCCERIGNLLTWISFVPLMERVRVLTPKVITFLEDSLQWIMRHLEFYGAKTGNHILNNARALIMLGTVLNNQKAVETGKVIFTRMLPVLIQPDGFLRERSSHYQLLILSWLLDAKYFLQASSFAENEILNKTILRMHAAARMVCDDAGYLQAMIGDISPDLSPVKTTQRLRLCYGEYWPGASPGMQHQRDDWWLLQNANNKILLNCPDGLYPQLHSSHGHNDIPSFVWLHNNVPMLIDCGRSRYTKDRVSSRQKSSRGHSLPFVNGFSPLCESFVINGNWWPTPYANADVAVAITDNTVTINHDGFKRATPVTLHQRKITLRDSEIEISDHFAGVGQAQIDLFWQLQPGFENFDAEKFMAKMTGIDLVIELNKMTIPPITKFFGTTAARSWCSSEYGFETANPLIIMRWQVTLPFTTTVIFRVQSCVV